MVRRRFRDCQIELESRPVSTPKPTAENPPSWRERLKTHRQEVTFLVVFLALLIGGFAVLSLNAVNDGVVEPFTGWVARSSGWLLSAIGQDVTMQGTVIQSPQFAVNIRNGCNGVEAMLIYFAAVLAFPATWKSRLLGVGLGFVAIQLVNLLRVVALFLTGVYLPKLFDSSHTVIWQTIVILSGVLLWILWANRFAGPLPAASSAPKGASSA